MPPLTPTQVDQYCQKLLEPITRKIAKRMGPEAAEHAGSCLYAALLAYDTTSTASVTTWAYSKTHNLVIETLRSLNGRKGTARYEANAARTSLTAGDEENIPVPVESNAARRVMDREGSTKTLQTISKGSPLQRCILIGRFFGDFTDTELQGMLLDVSKRQIYQEISDFQGCLSPG